MSKNRQNPLRSTASSKIPPVGIMNEQYQNPLRSTMPSQTSLVGIMSEKRQNPILTYTVVAFASLALILISILFSANSPASAETSVPATREVAEHATDATDSTDAADFPSPEILNNISQNCATIKQSLRQLQRADSRTRVYLGANFETVLQSFITPLGVRLARNNLARPQISEVEQKFASAQGIFRSAYTDYMREMETLINVDCQAAPTDFYAHLTSARARREALRLATAELSSLTAQQLKLVTQLTEEL